MSFFLIGEDISSYLLQKPTKPLSISNLRLRKFVTFYTEKIELAQCVLYYNSIIDMVWICDLYFGFHDTFKVT